MSTSTHVTVVGVFTDPEQAQRTLDALRLAGIRDEQIGFVARNGAVTPDRHDAESQAGEGAAVGGIIGGAIGVVWGLAVVAGLIPAIGPVIAGGVLAAIVASGALGAAVAGVAGFLMSLGIPEEEANYYQRELEAGRVLVTVTADQYPHQAVEIMRRGGAELERPLNEGSSAT